MPRTLTALGDRRVVQDSGNALNLKMENELRISGEYWSSLQLTDYRLVVVDHPETQVFTDSASAVKGFLNRTNEVCERG